MVTATLSPAHFARLTTRDRFQIPLHIKYLNAVLLDLVAGRLSGAVVSMPPRHGKSLLCSQYFPAWYVMTHPDARIILTSAVADLANDMGRRTRDIVAEFGYPMFGVAVRQDSKSARDWNIVKREGGMHCAGVGGSIIGRGAHLFICDDPIKTHEQALSKSYRDKAWEYFLSVAETRAEPGCIFLVIQTRWHEDDLAGRLCTEIRSGARKGWVEIRLPAIAEADDPLGRSEGDALWPERFPVEWLKDRHERWDCDEARLGAYWWESIYQQNPVPRSGGDFKRSWFQYYTEDEDNYILHRSPGEIADPTRGAETQKVIPKRKCYTFFTCDLAISEKVTADWFVLGIWRVAPDMDLLLSHVYRDHLQAPDQINLIHRLSREFSPAFISIESNGYQLALVQEAIRRGLPAKELRSDTDKRARAALASTRFAAGTVYFRSGASWLTPLESELLAFPNGKNDDQVDIMSMAAREVAEFVVPMVY
jgi:predicted phage terminase large subunit-like protein